MKYRCDNKNYKQYVDYGGRGISYDPSWSLFSNFVKDMGERPEGHTLLEGTRKRASGRWSSQITIDGKKIHLGTYDTEQEAHERFIQERKKRQAT